MANTITRFYLAGVLFVLTGGISTLHAQKAIPAAGGTIAGSGGSVSYTIGQVAYTTITGTGGTLSQGVQQPYEITVLSGIEEAAGIILECSVYPNPATDFAFLKIDNYRIENLCYHLYNAEGKLVAGDKVRDDITTIPLEDLVAGAYFLKVTENNREIKVFKLIRK